MIPPSTHILSIHLENLWHPSRVPALSIHIQLNLEVFRYLSCAAPMPISSASLPYGQASFTSCLDDYISLLVSLPLAFTFVITYYFLLKILICKSFFRDSLRTRNWPYLSPNYYYLLFSLSLSSVTLSALEVLSLPCSCISIPLHSCLSP